jgi:hypothetical protein
MIGFQKNNLKMMTDLAAIIVKIAYGSTDREVVPNGPNQPLLHHFLVGFMIAAFHTRKHVRTARTFGPSDVVLTVQISLPCING